MMDYNDLEYDILKVEEKEVGKRLDQFLANEYPDLSRSFLQTHIKEGYVLVNQHKKKNAYKVCFNDEIVIYFKKEEALDVKAENIPIDIIYEDDDVAVINKAANMVVHPSAGHPNHTLVNALLYHLKNLSTINGVFRPGIVHRLDKDTSGLLVVAKNDAAHQFLTNQLKDHTMYREYICLVKGILESQKGIIKTLIGRDKNNRLKNAVVKENGKLAITEFEVIKQYAHFTLLKCILKTGRTHQIRVHMDFIHHPIVNDPLYGENNQIAYASKQLLHAHQLTFIHPKSNQKMTFTAPLPQDFINALKTIKE